MLKEKLADKSQYFLDEAPRFQSAYFPNEEYPLWLNGANGIFLKLDFTSPYDPNNWRSFLRDEDKNLILNLISPELLIYQEVSFSIEDLENSKVLKINNTNSSDLSDDEIRLLISPSKGESLSLEVLTNKDELHQITFDGDFKYQNEVLMELYVEQISNIDSASQSFDAQFIEKFYYHLFGLEDIGFEIFKEIYGLEEKDFSFRSMGFHCMFTPDEISNLKLFSPISLLANAIEEDTRFEQYIYWFSYFGENDMQSYWEKHSIKSAKLKADFEYSSFPFDAQKIPFRYEILNDFITYPFVNRDTPTYISINNIELDNWDAKSFSYKNYLNDFHETMSKDDVGLEINFLLERSSIYYLTKVYIPILIILIVTLSILFIHPRELESRLTVGVVCFLALIAYTYVVDKDLPKLTYLTAMDKMILISYFFAALPIMQSIVIHNIFIS